MRRRIRAGSVSAAQVAERSGDEWVVRFDTGEEDYVPKERVARSVLHETPARPPAAAVASARLNAIRTSSSLPDDQHGFAGVVRADFW